MTELADGAQPIDDRVAELLESRALLDELFTDVVAAEGTLAGGTKLGNGGKALQTVRECTISIGNPKDNLIRLTPKLFNSLDIKLTDIWKKQLESDFNFYYLTLSVSLRSPQGISFESLECSLDFGPKGHDEPIVQTIFPTSRWRGVLNAEAGMSVALDGSLGWKVGAAFPLHVGQAKAKLSGSAGASGVIVAGNYSFQIGHAEISATGEGNSTCFWQLTNPEIRQVQTVDFAVVFKVPASVSNLSLRALCVAQPKTSWIVQSLRHVWRGLSDRVRQLLGRGDPTARSILVGDHEMWDLELPR